ncbi:MAG: antitoxin VbhA family protein [Oscillospiraceae bacterium]|nr:antitoxin VbhA family protein [Oscillospiraceae bacterium]
MDQLTRTVQNINASMEMENMPLSDAQKLLSRDILQGKISHKEALTAALSKYDKTKPKS